MTWTLVGTPSIWLIRFLVSPVLHPKLVILQRPKFQKSHGHSGIARGVWRLLLSLNAEVLCQAIRLVMRNHGKVYTTFNINDDVEARRLFRDSDSEVCIVRGGRILKSALLDSFRGKWINIHGGILPNYRGLDSHFWAASRGDWKSIGVTAHFLTEDVDKGQIIFKIRLENAENKNWFSLTNGIRKLENQANERLLLELPLLLEFVGETENVGEYFGKFPRCLNLVPILKGFK